MSDPVRQLPEVYSIPVTVTTTDDCPTTLYIGDAVINEGVAPAQSESLTHGQQSPDRNEDTES